MRKFLISTAAFCLFILLGSSMTASAQAYSEVAKASKDDTIQVFNYKNNRISISNDDIYLMAQTVFAESRAEPYTGKVAVASVILNRLLDPEFPKTVEGVIKQKGAFSCVINGKIGFAPTDDCVNAVYDALKGMDPTGEAVFFYNPKTATSRWMKEIKKANVKPIGNHVFFVASR